MKRWEEVRVPTDWVDVKKFYIKEKNAILIIGWETENEDEQGKVLATIDVTTKTLEYYDANAQFDGLAQVMVILAIDSIERNDYK